MNGLPNPAELDDILSKLTSIDNHLDSLDRGSAEKTETPQGQIIRVSLSDSGPATWIDPRQMILKRVIFSTNGTLRYIFRIGQDRSWKFGTTSATNPIELVGADNPVIIPKGIDIGIELVSGSATWDLIIWMTPGDAAGQSMVRQ